MGFWDDIGLSDPTEIAANIGTGGLYGLGKGSTVGAYNAASGGDLLHDITRSPGEEDERRRKQLLSEQAAKAGAFGNYGQTQVYDVNKGFGDYRNQLQRLASGQDSLSREQLRQGLQQNLASQQAMAASANPNNAVMAARNAAMNMGRAGYGMSGQAAMAGIQERNQANQLLGSALANQGQMNTNIALQSRQNAMQGYGAQNTGTPEKSWLEKYGPMIIGGAQVAATGKPPGA